MPDRSRLDFLRSAVEKNPAADFPRYGLAMELVSAGQHQEAEEQFLKLLEHHPDHVPGHFQLAKLYTKMERKEDAKRIHRQGIEHAKRKGDSHAQAEMEEELEQLEASN